MIAHLRTGEMTPGGGQHWTKCGRHLENHTYETKEKAERDVKRYADSKLCKRCF